MCTGVTLHSIQLLALVVQRTQDWLKWNYSLLPFLFLSLSLFLSLFFALFLWFVPPLPYLCLFFHRFFFSISTKSCWYSHLYCTKSGIYLLRCAYLTTFTSCNAVVIRRKHEMIKYSLIAVKSVRAHACIPDLTLFRRFHKYYAAFFYIPSGKKLSLFSIVCYTSSLVSCQASRYIY